METLSEGRITPLHVRLSSTINQVFLSQLADKTHRGLVGRIHAGFSGGGLCYGYELIPKAKARGQKGVFRVSEVEAEILRRIFRDYAAGASARVIAARLNAEGLPGRRGGKWAGSTIAGDRQPATAS